MTIRQHITSVSLPPRRVAATALGLAVASVSCPAFGQTGDDAVRLPQIKVEGSAGSGFKTDVGANPKLSQPLLDTPRSVTVVPRALFEEQGATSLGDVLRNVSGISLAAGEGGVPAGDNLTMRGFSARTDIFIDGVRDFGGYSRDAFNLEAVEVVKGPASAYSGRGATGGSINLITKKPALESITDASVTLGTAHTRRVTADINRAVGETAALRLNLMGHDAGVADRDEVEDKRWAVAPSLALGVGRPTRLIFSGLHLEQDNVPDYGHPYDAGTGKPVNVDRDNWYGLKSLDHEDTETSIGGILLEHDFSDRLTLRNQLSYGRTLRDSIATGPRNPDSVSDTVDRTFKTRDSEDTILSNQTSVSVKFATGGVRHTLVSGLELAREQSDNRTRSATTNTANLSHPNPNDAFVGSVTPTRLAEADADSVGVYLFDSVELGERWEFSGGLRWDRFEVDYRARDLATGVVTELDRSDNMLSWNVGAVYKPAPNGSVYAGFGSSFNPSAEGLTLRESTADLEPEESRTLELGTKWDLMEGRLGLTAAVFRTEKTNARTDGLPGEAPTVLDGEQRVDGLELGVVGQLSPDWQVFAGYTLLDSKITRSNDPAEDGNHLANVPENTFKLWSSYRVNSKLELGAGGQYVDSRYSRTSNLTQVPDYWLFDAMAAYDLGQNVRLRLNVYNLLDEEYYGNVGGGHAVPGAGRAALVTANFQF